MIAVNDYIILKKDRATITSNNILLLNNDVNSKDIGEPYTGTVLSVGDNVTIVNENDRVIFDDLSNPYILFDKDDILLILKESNIIGILSDVQ